MQNLFLPQPFVLVRNAFIVMHWFNESLSTDIIVWIIYFLTHKYQHQFGLKNPALVRLQLGFLSTNLNTSVVYWLIYSLFCSQPCFCLGCTLSSNLNFFELHLFFRFFNLIIVIRLLVYWAAALVPVYSGKLHHCSLMDWGHSDVMFRRDKHKHFCSPHVHLLFNKPNQKANRRRLCRMEMSVLSLRTPKQAFL